MICHRCNKEYKIKDTILKLGGLLCPNCSVILFSTYSKEYKKRLKK